MWRLSIVGVLGVLAGVLLLSTTAHGLWWWNSTIDVKGSEVRTVWAVLEEGEAAYGYHASLVVRIPKKAQASVIEQGTNETVKIKKSRRLSCTEAGINVTVAATVVPESKVSGTQVQISLLVNGEIASEKSGAVGEAITQSLLVPGTC